MFEKAKSGGQLIGSGIQAFIKHPRLIVPLLFSWSAYASIILNLRFNFDWDALSLSQTFMFVFGVIFTFSMLLCFSASWLLEMIEQIETGEPLGVFRALGETLNANLVRMVPIAFVWATIWFVLAVLDALTKDDSKNEADEKLSFESATKVLTGAGEESSWTGFSFDLAKKLVRMVVFLSLPAVCWRNMNGFSAMGEGLRTARKHPVELFTGYLLTGLAAVIIFLPASLPIYLESEEIIKIPDNAWPALFFYIAFAWSFSIYLEQMFTAELYLWHMKWEKAVAFAKANGKIEPKLSEIPRPSLIDNSADLNEVRSSHKARFSNAYQMREAAEYAGTYGPLKIECAGCTYEFKLKSAKELPLHDYDMDASNGVQLKCPECGYISYFDPAKKRA